MTARLLEMPPRKRPELSARAASDRAADAGDPSFTGAPFADEHQVLVGCRRHDILDRLRSAVSERPARFRTELASIVNLLQVRLADAFYSALQGASADILSSQHSKTVDMIELCHALCSDISVLHSWHFSEEQQAAVAARLSQVCGHGKVFQLRVAPVVLLEHDQEEVCDAPFLLSALYILLSAQFGLFSLIQMLARANRGRWDRSGRTFVPLDFVRDLPAMAFDTGEHRGIGNITVHLRGNSISEIRFEHPWPQTERRRCSNFLPDYIRLPVSGIPEPLRLQQVNSHSGVLTLPSTDVAFLTLAKANWVRRLGTLSAELDAILSGRYCIAKSEDVITPIYCRNHPSWEDNPEAQAALWPEIARMIWKGVLEYVSRHCRLPLCIVAVGAVPKNTAPFWRLITDCRPINHFAVPWRVKYITLSGLSLLLSPSCFFWVIDLTAAYHSVALGGCGRPYIEITRFQLSQDGKSYVPYKTRIYGCTPETCNGCCDKSYMGIMLNGFCFRFACCTFGHRTSNGPLAVLTDAILKHAAQRESIDGACYVDDFVFVHSVTEHSECTGFLGGCVACIAAHPRALQDEAYTHALLDDLNMNRNDKGEPLGQVGVYIGIQIDTVRRLYLLTQKKSDKLFKGIADVLEAHTMSSRSLSKLHGKLVTYSVCVQRLRPFTAPLRIFIGAPKSDGEWDAFRSDASLDNVKRVLRFLTAHLQTMIDIGAPIWPLEASTLYHLWTVGQLPPGVEVIVVTWDASAFGVGFSFRSTPETILRCEGRVFDRVSSVATFAEHLDIQPHREAWGGAIAVRSLVELGVKPGTVLICINDCSGALHALCKGSSKPNMQAAAEQLNSDCIIAGLFPVFLHVSGEALIADGHDEASRDKAKSLLGPSCSPRLWQTVLEAAREAGWELTVDMFAAAANAKLPRFMSWTDEAECEQVDCFASRTWASSLCPSCEIRHTECGWYFPPSAMVEQCVKRALSDGARGLFLVPTNIKAPYWLALRRVSTVQKEIAADASFYTNCAKPLGRHTLFAADFSNTPADHTASPPCRQAFVRRAKGRLLDRAELAQQEAIRGQLLVLASNAAHDLPSSPRGARAE